jgi:hypothetical protein
MIEELIRLGTPEIMTSRSPESSYSVVFADDGRSGYLYALDRALPSPVVDALHMYDVGTNAGRAAMLQLFWPSADKAVVMLDGEPVAVADFDTLTFATVTSSNWDETLLDDVTLPAGLSRSAGGSQIKQYQHETVAFDMPAAQDVPLLAAIQQHLNVHVAKTANAGEFLDMTPSIVNVTVFHYQPTPHHPYHLLITAGMSQRAMPAPVMHPEATHAELMLALPADWDLSPSAVADRSRRWSWPVELLHSLAKTTHLYGAWLWHSHTVPNGAPLTSYAPSTNLSVSLIAQPTLLDIPPVRVSDGRNVEILAVLPVYADEYRFLMERGPQALLDELDRAHVTEILDPRRDSVV